jgi:glycosyltransferase involved in cell wall biosynthesis
MIARAFPPFLPVGHSIRVVKFAKYLPALGWLPLVLTIDDRNEYETTPKLGSATMLSEIPPQVRIHRTTAGEPSLAGLEKEKRFGRRSRLTRAIMEVLAGARRWTFRNIFLPDRYLAWLPFAVRRGRQLVRREAIDVIFATSPPYSASLVGACLKRLTGKPLVLDFRDDWIGTPWYHSKPALTRMIYRRLERGVVRAADKVILVTEWSQNAFLERYPAQRRDKFVLIPNGCDLGEFAGLKAVTVAPRNSGFTIVHAGSLTDSKTWGRSPEGLFQAIRQLLQQHPEMAEKLTLVFAGDLPERNRRTVEEMHLSGVVRELGYLSHEAVLRLMASADLLLAINYEGWSTLIPGKIYEYWAVGGPPILLLSCPGAAAGFVERHGLGLTVDPYDVTGIREAILKVYRQRETVAPLRLSTAGIEPYDRQALTRDLAQVLSTACDRCGS